MGNAKFLGQDDLGMLSGPRMSSAAERQMIAGQRATKVIADLCSGVPMDPNDELLRMAEFHRLLASRLNGLMELERDVEGLRRIFGVKL